MYESLDNDQAETAQDATEQQVNHNLNGRLNNCSDGYPDASSYC
jgi:hypothetical protein